MFLLWAISQYVKPLLPSGVTETTAVIVASSLAMIGAIGSIGDALEFTKTVLERLRGREPELEGALGVADAVRPADVRRAFVPSAEFIGRYEDLQSLLGALRDPTIPLVTLKGLGGIGKTALAQESLRLIEAEHVFEDVFWHSSQAEKFVGEGTVRTEVAQYSFAALIDDLLRHAGITWNANATAVVKAQLLGGWLSEHRMLIVLDNLETVPERDSLVAALLDIVGRSKVLVTSRFAVLPSRAFVLDLEGLSEHDGVRFLGRIATRQNNRNLMNASRETLSRIHKVTGGAPLAMLLVSGQMDYQPVEQVLRLIEEAGFNELSYEFYSFVFRQAWQELKPSARKVLIAMRHFAGSPTEDAVKHTVDLADADFYSALEMLGRRSLLGMVPARQPRYSLHPLTRYFINTDIAASWG